jgi:hypothetical protein
LHVWVTYKAALAAATASFGTTACLHVAVANKPTMARPASADGAAIGLAVRVLDKAAVGLLGEGGQESVQAGQPKQDAKVFGVHSSPHIN